MELDFYYWGWQCPLHVSMLQLLEAFRGRLEITCHDVTDRPELARQMRMFFPTLAVAGGGKRYFSPLRPELLEALCRGELPDERPYRPPLGVGEVSGVLELLTEDNLPLACRCTGDPACPGCREKAAWLERLGMTVFGCVNRAGDRLLGGAEYIPSMLVPYDIPRGPDAAFLTCVYGSAPEADYKSGPLRMLEQFLSRNYGKALVISDENGVFPNGDLNFFRRNGYEDLGLFREEPGYCRLHLMEKELG